MVEALRVQVKDYPRELKDGPLVASAFALAMEMDMPNSATSKSNCGKVLLETLERISELAPKKKERDLLDDRRDVFAARREAADRSRTAA